MERRIERLESEGRAPACVVMEAAMMNLGIIPPEPGYLEAVRELTARRGIVLIFDEVKTGFAIAAGGGAERVRGKTRRPSGGETPRGGRPPGGGGRSGRAEGRGEGGGGCHG